MNQDLINDLLEFLINKEEFQNCFRKIHCHLHETFMSCLQYCLNPARTEAPNKKLEIDSIIDYLHDELNTGHWSEVPLNIRHGFSAASYLKCIILLKNLKVDENLLIECLRCIDMGLLLGAPIEENPLILTDSANLLSRKLNENNDKTDIRDTRKRKFCEDSLDTFKSLKGSFIDTVSCPSLESFNNTYFSHQIPVKLTDCMTHWPAMTKWLDVNYLLNTAGNRTVPVELGSHYADENWSQKLMTLKEFIRKHFMADNPTIGYLAQHNLFDQIPELKNDIFIPEYCCLSSYDEDIAEPDINAWFGPGKTVSPLHQDPKNNILAQVFGTKQIMLFSPKDNSFLHTHEGNLMSNTSQVDPINPDLKKYPNFKNAVMYKCLLEPGEMLYIPIKWWHHVTALEKSFSISFWW